MSLTFDTIFILIATLLL